MPKSTPVVREGDLVSPADVRTAVSATIRPLPPSPVKLVDAAGLVVPEPFVAPFALPPFDNAAMDGFALRSVDTEAPPSRLRVMGSALAGRPFRSSLNVGGAVSIATGAMLPEGADAVVAIEDVTADGDHVVVDHPVERGRHVRKAGEDIERGAQVLEAGMALGPGQLAALAAFGVDEITVHARPRVAVLPTGDELRRPGEELGPGEIYESVSTPLAALIAEAGGVPITRAVARDDEVALERAVAEAAAEADMVVTVGGVSMGERDLIHTLQRSCRIRTYQVALRPARPFAFGQAFGVPLFGLPGNPAAALAAFEELVRPALLALMGKRPDVRQAVPAILVEAFAQRPGRLHLVRVEVWREGSGLRARPAGRQGAGMIHSLARAQGWAVIPPEVEELSEGAEIQVRLLVEAP
jgi:molybdopterin molybdotransferase